MEFKDLVNWCRDKHAIDAKQVDTIRDLMQSEYDRVRDTVASNYEFIREAMSNLKQEQEEMGGDIHDIREKSKTDKADNDLTKTTLTLPKVVAVIVVAALTVTMWMTQVYRIQQVENDLQQHKFYSKVDRDYKEKK